MNGMMLLALGISGFLQSAQQSLAYYGSVICSIVGIVMVIAGIYQIAKNLISHGKGQTNWVVTIMLILVGGMLAITGGWSAVGGISNVGSDTIKNMASGSADTGAAVEDPFNQ